MSFSTGTFTDFLEARVRTSNELDAQETRIKVFPRRLSVEGLEVSFANERRSFEKKSTSVERPAFSAALGGAG